MLGDKHSGEPVEIECGDDTENNATFVVADIRELGQKKRTGNAEVIKVWGRIVDKDHNPVAGAYVFANRAKAGEAVPEYLSVWTDASGRYSLYLPSGVKFFMGGSMVFPPVIDPATLKEWGPQTTNLDIATDIQLIVY
jgi:hypothetical protein